MIPTEKKIRYVGPLIVCIFSLICVWIGLLFLHSVPFKNTFTEIESEVYDSAKELETLQNIVNATRARAVVVYDMSRDSIIAQKRSTEVRSLASLTKLVTASLVYQSYQSTTSRATILPRIQHMLTTSSNDEAKVLANSFANTEVEQVAIMNRYAKPYNMTFKNVSGLDIILDDGVRRQPSSQGNAVSIARFVADIYVQYPELFDTTIHPRENTNISVNNLSFMLGGKTGLTDLAGGNLMVITQKGISQRYLIVVLGSTENGRFVDVENIAKALLQLHI